MITVIQEVRIAVGDTDTSFPILDDDTYSYFLTKNSNSVRRAALEAARSILLQLSMRGDETVDIFTVKGSKVAEQYRMSLQMFLRDPSMNPVLTSVSAYAGGISKVDMLNNLSNADNNALITPGLSVQVFPTDPFSV